MSQQGRDERAVRNSMDVDKTMGATDCQHGSRANRGKRARGDKAPTTGGKASLEQTASKEDVETKRLLEEFRALVTLTLWECVQTAACAYYSKIFKVEKATCACNAQELQKSVAFYSHTAGGMKFLVLATILAMMMWNLERYGTVR
ncbi:hypothetical protein N657DRAFT_693401 [Parathielavia appendiculata]|uniref:Uncharacterized protein n=1 Tax=Parathielavia appendiculata TaxID=2587402 RepID=A0AAN6TSM0_9PEZI|nr:hypothetical protein N657DRAFT_693401 [Parathielavia appendiculata]